MPSDHISNCNNVIDIVSYPNNVLSTKAVDVLDFENGEYKSLIESLISTMADYGHCVGLAANQIGSNFNVFVADSSKNKREPSKYGFVIVVNPKIIKSNGIIKKREGCMSVPDLTVDVERFDTIEISALNQYGEAVNYTLDGFESRVFQHEIDHLRGNIILDCAKSSRDIYSRKNYRK